MNSGDVAWVLMSTGLVLFMTPALAVFYGGLVRKKNVLSVLMQCFMAMAVISILWVVAGYSLSFAPGNAFIGGLGWLGLKGIGSEPFAEFAATIPHSLFMIFQAMFAVITPALIIGAFAERIKFSAYLWFIILWSFLVYAPVCHWVWGSGGFFKMLGAVDFAGGAVVHINAGVAALVTALIIGKRKNYKDIPTHPHNLPLAVLGAGMLWFGWFGFNAGSALAANGVAVNALIATNTAAAAAVLAWAFLERYLSGAVTMLGVISGAIAGLAAVTPAAGYVGIWGAIAIGVVSSIMCYLAISKAKSAFRYDDTLDAFGIHGISGIWGTIATGIFASKAINPAGVNGLLYGDFHQFILQVQLTATTLVYSLVVTYIIFKTIDLVIGVRVETHKEEIGIDLSQHNERAYTLVE